MQTVKKRYESLTEVNRSKFLTFLVPYTAFPGLQEELKKEHPKANHMVYAIRYLNEYDQIVENSTDDGEPKGCAGVPALNVLRGEELIECAVLIVRYFGGIKLGTGGMARAYAQAVKDVLAHAELNTYEKRGEHTFTTDYSAIDRTLYRLKQYGIRDIERKYGVNKVIWKIAASEEKIKNWKSRR